MMNNFSDFVRQHAEEAQARYNQIEEESRKRLRSLIDRSRSQREETRKRVDDFFQSLRSQEVVDRLRSADIKAQVAEVRHEVLDLFGIASREELARLEDEVRTLRAELKKLRKAAPKKSAAKKTAAKKTATKKAQPKAKATKKAQPKAKATKKASAKAGNGKSAKAATAAK